MQYSKDNISKFTAEVTSAQYAGEDISTNSLVVSGYVTRNLICFLTMSWTVSLSTSGWLVANIDNPHPPVRLNAVAIYIPTITGTTRYSASLQTTGIKGWFYVSGTAALVTYDFSSIYLASE